MKKYYYTYKITLLNGRLAGHYYYGQHTSTKIIDTKYVGSGKIINEYFKKYAKKEGETFTREILCYYDSIEALDEAEIKLIGDKWKTDPLCLNLIKGGRQSSINEAAHKCMSDKAKQRTSPMKDKHHTEESKEKNRQAHLGKTHASYTGWNQKEETKQQISSSRKGKYTGENNHNYGKHITDMMSADTLEKRNKKIQENALGQIWINNGTEQKHVSPDELNKYLDLGYVLGGIKGVNKVMNNGIITKYVKIYDINNYLNEGWSFGSCKKNYNKGKTWYYDETLNKRVWVTNTNITN